MSVTELDVRSDLRERLESVNGETVTELAEAILEDVDEAWLAELGRVSLRRIIQYTLKQQRNQTIRDLDRSADQPSGSAYEAQVGELLSSRQIDLLRMPVTVNDRVKPLGSCTTKDLAIVEASSREKAEQNVHRADQYKRVRLLLARKDARTPADLPNLGDLREAWNGR